MNLFVRRDPEAVDFEVGGRPPGDGVDRRVESERLRDDPVGDREVRHVAGRRRSAVENGVAFVVEPPADVRMGRKQVPREREGRRRGLGPANAIVTSWSSISSGDIRASLGASPARCNRERRSSVSPSGDGLRPSEPVSAARSRRASRSSRVRDRSNRRRDGVGTAGGRIHDVGANHPLRPSVASRIPSSSPGRSSRPNSVANSTSSVRSRISHSTSRVSPCPHDLSCRRVHATTPRCIPGPGRGRTAVA